MFFRLGSVELGLLLFGIVLGTTLLGVVAGLDTPLVNLRESMDEPPAAEGPSAP